MGRRQKSKKGFNTPFANVELPPAKQPATAPVAGAISGQVASPDASEETSDSEEQLFADAMRGVEPFEQNGARIEPHKRETANLPNDDELVVAELESLVRGESPFNLEDTGLMVSGRAPGVSHKIIDQLQKGTFAVRRHIDLHGCTRETARDLLNQFIAESRRSDARCVLVVTGRGLRSPHGMSVLREALPRWLARAPSRAHVLAFCTAQSIDGGPGAFYVLLRRPGKRPYGA